MKFDTRSNSQQLFRVRAVRTQAVMASKARMARSLRARAVGLLGRRELPPDEALIFPWCSSIHTVGMRFPIDVIFVDRRWRIVALKAGLPPGKMPLPVWRAWGVIETRSGTVERMQLAIGDQLEIAPCSLTKT